MYHGYLEKECSDLLVSRINFFSAHFFLVGGWGGHYSSPVFQPMTERAIFLRRLRPKKLRREVRTWVWTLLESQESTEILLDGRNPANQLRLVVSPMIYQGFFYISGISSVNSSTGSSEGKCDMAALQVLNCFRKCRSY